MYLLPADGCKCLCFYGECIYLNQVISFPAPLPFHYKIIMGATGGKKLEGLVCTTVVKVCRGLQACLSISQCVQDS